MEECKRLFKRDKIFLLCLSGAVVFILLAGFINGWRLVRQLLEMKASFMEIHGEAFVEEFFSDDGMIFSEILEYACISMMKWIFAVVLLAQILKWGVLEGRRGREFANQLPLKSAGYVTYDYILGILFLWIPIAVEFVAVMLLSKGYGLTFMGKDVNENCVEIIKELILVSFLYSLLVLSKKITRYIPGIFLTVPVVFGIGVILGWDISVFWDLGRYSQGERSGYLLLAASVPVFVALSYWCDKKRDIAGNGLFYFKPVHFFMMAAIFAELFYIFLNSEIIQRGMAANVVGVLIAGTVTAGVHYLTWGERSR